MASKTKMKHDTGPRQSGAELGLRDRLPQAATDQEIRCRASEIYLARGAQPGHELEDWLQAELELTANPLNSPNE